MDIERENADQVVDDVGNRQSSESIEDEVDINDQQPM